jgi:hypothetical protein
MIKVLAKIANKLDSLGLSKEADVLDAYIKKEAYAVPVYSVFDKALETCNSQPGCKINHSGTIYVSLGGGQFKDPEGNNLSSEELKAELAKNKISISDKSGNILYNY